MPQNYLASTLALARTVRSGIDRKKLDTPVQTEALILLLDTLIEIGSASPVTQRLGDGAARTVMGMVAQVKDAERGP